MSTKILIEDENENENENENEHENNDNKKEEKNKKNKEDEDNIILNNTYTHIIDNLGFGNLPLEIITEAYKDGRPFSHFIELWLAINYPLTHVKGCKPHDHVNVNNTNIKYDQKTFTKQGCKFMPSNMLGQGRSFDPVVFKEKAEKLIYIIVSNINFPEIKIKFVKGIDLVVDYPNGIIPLKDFNKFFN